MPTVSGKQRLCKCHLNRFKSFEGLNGHPWYERYDDIADIVAHNIDKQYCHFLAQPVLDGEEILWFTEPYSEQPRRLNELSGAEHELYSHIKDDTMAHYRDAISRLKNQGHKNEALALESTISSINDEFVYCYDGKTVLGIWGMKPRDEFRQALGIVTNNDFEDPKRKKNPDSSTPYGNDNPDKLYNNPDNPHLRPDPQDEKPKEEEGSKDEEPKEEKPQDEDPDDDRLEEEEPKATNLYNVDFIPTDGGHLQGTTHYSKEWGSTVQPNEVPMPVPDEGYEFIGWDIQPEGYCIKGDTLFTAYFRKKNDNDNNDNNNHIISDDENDNGRNDNDDDGDNNDDGGDGNDDSGDGNDNGDTVIVDDPDDNWHKGNWLTALLNWLLLLLMLGLIFMLIWCLLLGRCHMNLCGGGCNCIDTVFIDTTSPQPQPEPGPLPPVNIDTSCNSSVASGGDEGFLGTFDMKQPSGTFRFTFNTYNQPDLVTIYDGSGTNGKTIFSNRNNTSTRDSVSTMVHFNQQTITVQVISLQPPGTAWNFIVYCPKNCPQNQ